MSRAAAYRVLRWDVANAKRMLRDERDIDFLKLVFTLEKCRKSARKRLVNWLRDLIAQREKEARR